MKKIIAVMIMILSVFSVVKNSFAIPALQLYIEGSQYDTATSSWIVNSNTFKLWILGDVGNRGSIFDVKLVAAYDSNDTGNIDLVPTTATSGLLPFPGDPSIPVLPTYYQSGSDIPPLNDAGEPLPPHGIYGPGVSWNTYKLGDFTAKDSPIGDYTNGDCPDGSCTYSDKWGQINAYDVTINGYEWVHFDAFDHVISGNKVRYIFAPFSHDAFSNETPEPATLTLLGLGLIGLAGARRKKS